MMWLSFPLGVLAWTFAEYVLHRFDGHGMRGKTAFSREHLAHHADPLYFAPWWKKALAAVAVLLLFGGVGGWLFGAVALPFSVGFGGAYLGYEWIHRRIHTHAPVGAYGGWVRRHHLVHSSPHNHHCLGRNRSACSRTVQCLSRIRRSARCPGPCCRSSRHRPPCSACPIPSPLILSTRREWPSSLCWIDRSIRVPPFVRSARCGWHRIHRRIYLHTWRCHGRAHAWANEQR